MHRDDTLCTVIKTNNGVTIGRNNNVTVEFSGTGQTTGFQCILDKQQPYFECMLFNYCADVGQNIMNAIKVQDQF